MSDAKTKLGRRRFALVLVGVVLIMAVAGIVAIMSMQPKKATDEVEPAAQRSVARIAGKTFELEIADDGMEQHAGLSGRESLAENRAMLFIFDVPGQQCIWMKDMNFPLDILWLGDDKKILRIAEDISPDTYPESFCAENTRYVIEMNAGLAARYGIAVGQTVQLQL